MNEEVSSNLRLSFPGQDQTLTELEAINATLRGVGSEIWPLETGAAPEEICALLETPSLDKLQSQRVMDYFLLPRERLLDIVVAAGRTPRTERGGSLTTTDKTHDVVYPQLYQVLEGVDYTRFDRFHVNRSLSGTGVDEVMQILCGRGVILRQQLSSGDTLRLEIDCPPDQGWILTYDGDLPHIGSISGASLGAKILMQVFGPTEWEMHYV